MKEKKKLRVRFHGSIPYNFQTLTIEQRVNLFSLEMTLNSKSFLSRGSLDRSLFQSAFHAVLCYAMYCSCREDDVYKTFFFSSQRRSSVWVTSGGESSDAKRKRRDSISLSKYIYTRTTRQVKKGAAAARKKEASGIIATVTIFERGSKLAGFIPDAHFRTRESIRRMDGCKNEQKMLLKSQSWFQYRDHSYKRKWNSVHVFVFLIEDDVNRRRRNSFMRETKREIFQSILSGRRQMQRYGEIQFR